jgi:GNAT superfamily N-acetyltransferase
MSTPSTGSAVVVRLIRDEDLAEVADMIDDFVRGHPAEHRPRSQDRLRTAYLGADPVARLFVAVRRGRVVGMCQWSRLFDAFWSMFGGKPEWLYVRPEARGLGIPAALIAVICDDVRRAGGEYLCAGYGDPMAGLYERVSVGAPVRECHLSGEAFQVFADLAGRPPRDIVRSLPAPELNRVPPRPRA